MKDILFKKSISKIKKFSFDFPVVQVFDDMIERSVPFYSENLKMCAELIKHLVPKQANIFDVGCSTGNIVSILLELLNKKKFNYIGLDNSFEMLSEATIRYQKYKNIYFKHTNSKNINFEKADAVLLNYTLQFIDISDRSLLLKKIFHDLNPKGILILSEKIVSQNPLFEKLHINFKKKKGYSQLEISQKREALDKVLSPLSLEENINNLREAGFHKIEVFFKWYNFASILAQK